MARTSSTRRVALASIAGGYGRPVDLQRAAPGALAAYPLIVTRRDPLAARPPAAYSLAWQGTYYQVWARRPGAPAALAHVALGGAPAQQCARLAQPVAPACCSRLAAGRRQRTRGSCSVAPARARAPAPLGSRARGARAEPIRRAVGELHAAPRREWSVWLQGQLMPTRASVGVDGARWSQDRRAARGQLARARHDAAADRRRCSAGAHRADVTARTSRLRRATAARRFSTRCCSRRPGRRRACAQLPARGWRALCGRPTSWVELVPVPWRGRRAPSGGRAPGWARGASVTSAALLAGERDRHDADRCRERSAGVPGSLHVPSRDDRAAAEPHAEGRLR